MLTSGGDAPGMNAAIRAVVRTVVDGGGEAVGVRDGFAGLVAGDVHPMDARDVGGIIQNGGTVLGSARCTDFHQEGVQRQALSVLAEHGIEGLAVIGGNGSQAGAYALARHGFPVVGIASTIDNDLVGSEVTIGVDTALNIALEAIDRLRVTASSHRRGFAVEVMGRDCGYLALMTGIAGGAEAILIPEIPMQPAEVAEILRSAHQRGKAHAMVVVAEGASVGAARLVDYIGAHHEGLGFTLRATILGHVQRGGTPTAFDRLLASRLGAAAATRLLRNEHGVLVGLQQGRIGSTPLAEVVGRQKPLDPDLLALLRTLAR